jgi:hypothetical protein
VAAATNNDTASFLRGKAFIAGIRDDTPLATACDVYLVLEIEGVPSKEMKDWRQRLDRQIVKAKPIDRDSWGTSPEQLREMSRLTSAARG